jgi:signal transduction histidine kinase
VTRRILLSYLSLALFILLVLEIPLAVFFADREQERFAADVASDAAVLATHFEDTLEYAADLDPSLAEDYAEDTGARVVVVDVDGRSIVDTDAPPGRPFASRPEIAVALSGTPTRGTRRSDTLGADLLYVATPVASGGVVHGAVRITVPTADVDARVRRFWLGLGLTGALVLVAVAGLGALLARSMTRPLRQLVETATAFGRGELAPRPVPPRTPHEVAALHETMNAMAGDLLRILETQRAFVADASHQLRTPLTALRLRVENLGALVSPDDQREAEAAIAEIERLSDLVEQLLLLARADRLPPAEVVDLAAIARDRVETWQAVAEAAGVELAVTASGPAPARAAPGSIEQAVDNVIDNAVAESPAGSSVVIEVHVAQDTVSLAVVDHGPGLDDEARARALDRFWRGRTDRPGTGLGLPIAAAVAAAHGGTITLTDTPGGGLTVTLTLPAARS